MPVVVTKSAFHDRPIESTGVTPPPLDRKLAASLISFMLSNGVIDTSPPSPVSSPSGPLASMLTPAETSSTCPSSSAVIEATRL